MGKVRTNRSYIRYKEMKLSQTTQPGRDGYQPDAKTKVSQSFFDAVFSTEKTAKKMLRDPRVKGDLLKQEEIQRFIWEGFSGLELSVPEQRVIHGIFNLMSNQEESALKGYVEIEGLAELYAAMGVSKHETKRGKMEYSGWEINRLNKAFWALSEKCHRIIFKSFKEYDPVKQQLLYDVVVMKSPLFQVTSLYRDVEEGKIVQVKREMEKTNSQLSPHKIIIKLNPVMFAAYHNRWRFLPSDPYSEIKSVLPPGHRVMPYHINFIYWLHRHREGQREISSNKKAIAMEIGLGQLLLNRQTGRLWKKLSETYAIAKELGYLTAYEEYIPTQRGGVKDVFHLNPSKIGHAKKKEGDADEGLKDGSG